MTLVNKDDNNLKKNEQNWHSLLDDASKIINYRLFKDYFGVEEILDNKNVLELYRLKITVCNARVFGIQYTYTVKIKSWKYEETYVLFL